MFIGREKELERLASFYSSDFFDIAVIYGRRRIGKSFLFHKIRERFSFKQQLIKRITLMN